MTFEEKIENVLQGKKKIIVYGAGNIGRQCKNYINNSIRYNFVGWVDKYKAGEKIDEYTLIGISDISVLDYDCVLIAIDNIKIKRTVQRELVSNGIDKAKIQQWICDVELVSINGFKFESTKDNRNEVYQKIEILNKSNLLIGDILRKVGVEKVYIYGEGEIAELIYAQVCHQVHIEESIEGDTPIIFTQTIDTAKAMYTMIRQGIKRERIWSLNSLLSICVKVAKIQTIQFNVKNQFLITGAQFANKGAQAMLYVAMHEIKSRYSNAIIWYLPCNNETYKEGVQEKYNMIFLQDGSEEGSEVFEVLPMLRGIVDVSGYALSACWDCRWYIRILQMAYYYKIPLFLMPQSYGELDFLESTQIELKKTLQAARVVYAREAKGFSAMKETFELDNIRLSKDLVLQNKGVDFENIYNKDIVLSSYEIKNKEAIAIVPNVRCYEWGNKEEILGIYKKIIVFLLENKKSIYIISHSDDDEICRDIYELFDDNMNIYLFQKEFDCMGYSQLIRNFQYVIGSRYHAVVHALKEHVPCIAIGWAVKYIELMKLFQQDEYVFDVREKLDVDKILKSLEKMEACYEQESQMISSFLAELQTENCFEVLEELKRENN